MVDRMDAERSFALRVFDALKTWLAKVRDVVHRSWLSHQRSIDPHVVASTEPLWIRLVNGLEKELRSVALAEYAETNQRAEVAAHISLINQTIQQSHNLLVRIPNEVQQHLQQLIATNVAAGKTPAEIESAIDAYLDATGSENWQNRAKVIAATEVHRLANSAVQAAGTAVSHLERVPLTKQWITRHDDRVRRTHVEADGQIVPVQGMFHVGNSLMLYPGAPEAPAEEVVNCRCSMRINDRSAA